MLRFGWAVAPNIVLSGEFTGWASQTAGGISESLGYATVVAQIYPSESDGLFVKLGVGFASGKQAFDFPSVGTIQLNLASTGLEIGTGFDIAVTRRFSLTPFADFLYGSPTTVTVNGSTTGVRISTTLVHVGLSASWR